LAKKNLPAILNKRGCSKKSNFGIEFAEAYDKFKGKP
jgi:hypothetical protein